MHLTNLEGIYEYNICEHVLWYSNLTVLRRVNITVSNMVTAFTVWCHGNRYSSTLMQRWKWLYGHQYTSNIICRAWGTTNTYYACYCKHLFHAVSYRWFISLLGKAVDTRNDTIFCPTLDEHSLKLGDIPYNFTQYLYTNAEIVTSNKPWPILQNLSIYLSVLIQYYIDLWGWEDIIK